MTSERTGKLVVVGTPIGNLDDLSPRAARVLSEADAIFCEDTRVTAKLASRVHLAGPRISCPAPRERSRVRDLLDRLGRGETVALVSDAGMPSLSDPGEQLVDAAAAGHYFAGFLPSRPGERRRALERLRDREETMVWFEAPHRLLASLDDAARILGARRACVARELTKLHEEAVRGTLPELAAIFRARETGRGEVTVVVGGSAGRTAQEPPEDVERKILQALARGESKRGLARDIARRSGRSAREIYAQAVALEDRKE